MAENIYLIMQRKSDLYMVAMGGFKQSFEKKQCVLMLYYSAMCQQKNG